MAVARQRQPIALVQANGRKHLTKAEVEQRSRTEVRPCTDDITAPAFLTKKQKREFDQIAAQLAKLHIMGETDVDTLGRYVATRELYVAAVRDVRMTQKQKPEERTAESMAEWAELMDKLDRRVERYAKQVQAYARDLGLTISSRCKLVVPEPAEPEKQNKFAQFSQREDGTG